jgi:enoyl-CoA hydratase/carnithine racemase
MADAENLVLAEVKDRILHVTMNRPEKKNALSLAMYDALTAALERADSDDEIRVVLITGTGGAFTSGNDVLDFMNAPPADDSSPVVRFLRAITHMHKPIVAAVNGIAIGIGTTMLLHCDLAYAGEGAKFQMPFVNLGLCPEAASSLLLPQYLGHRKAAELILLGEKFDAQTALACGLVNGVVPDADLLATAQAKAAQLAAQPPASLRISKALLKAGNQAAIQHQMAEEGRHFLERLTSLEAVEAFTAFIERRKPDFSAFK